MTQQHARISCENLPVLLKLENMFISLLLSIGLKEGDSFEHYVLAQILILDHF